MLHRLPVISFVFRREEPRCMEGQKAILVFRIGQVGDSVVALPAVELIRAAYPGSRIVVLNDRQAASQAITSGGEVFEASGLVDEVISYNTSAQMSEWIRLGRELRSRSFSRAICLLPERSLFQRVRDFVALRVIAGIPNVEG